MHVRVVANDDPDVRKRFHSRMLRIYADAKREVGYIATYILRMLSERGGVGTARRLIASNQPSDGFT